MPPAFPDRRLSAATARGARATEPQRGSDPLAASGRRVAGSDFPCWPFEVRTRKKTALISVDCERRPGNGTIWWRAARPRAGRG